MLLALPRYYLLCWWHRGSDFSSVSPSFAEDGRCGLPGLIIGEAAKIGLRRWRDQSRRLLGIAAVEQIGDVKAKIILLKLALASSSFQH